MQSRQLLSKNNMTSINRRLVKTADKLRQKTIPVSAPIDKNSVTFKNIAEFSIAI